MGCGHSKSNIQSKKDRNRNNVRKEEIPQKDSDDDSVDSDVEEVHEKASEMKTITAKTNEIPLTVAQKKLSSSQQNFFKMLDEKIEKGRDYDDSNSLEIATENARLASLLKDWETASAGSRSLEGTPKKNTFHTANGKPNIAAVVNNTKSLEKRIYTRQNTTPIPQAVIHQSYGVTPMSTRDCSLTYIQANNEQLPSSSSSMYQSHGFNDYSYQAFSPLCATQLVNNGSPLAIRSSDNLRLCSIRAKQNIIPQDNNNSRLLNHPKPPLRKPYANGDLIQQQIQLEQVQYRQAKELAHFRLMKEQQLVQQQQLQLQHNQVMMRNYQSSIHIPMTVAQTYKEVLNKSQIER
ncbi:hypothetical protein Trydic_g13244 [Trypoxylus dichotomus]